MSIFETYLVIVLSVIGIAILGAWLWLTIDSWLNGNRIFSIITLALQVLVIWPLLYFTITGELK